MLETVAQLRQIRKEATVSERSLCTSGSREAGVFYDDLYRRSVYIILYPLESGMKKEKREGWSQPLITHHPLILYYQKLLLRYYTFYDL